MDMFCLIDQTDDGDQRGTVSSCWVVREGAAVHSCSCVSVCKWAGLHLHGNRMLDQYRLVSSS